MPTEFSRHILDVLLDAGEPLGLGLAGMLAMDSLRLEKGYRHFGHDVCDEDHVLEAGLGFAVKTDKPRSSFGDFLGREAVLRKRAQGISRRLLQFKLLDPVPLLFHGEPIAIDGEISSYLTSGGYGHTLEAAVGMGYVPCAPGSSVSEFLHRKYAVEVAGRRIPAQASTKPFYDSENVRIRS